MNVSVLKDFTYVSLMRAKIPEFIDQHKNLDPHLKWKMIKSQISELTQKYCRTIQLQKSLEKNQTKKNAQ